MYCVCEVHLSELASVWHSNCENMKFRSKLLGSFCFGHQFCVCVQGTEKGIELISMFSVLKDMALVFSNLMPLS